MAPKTKTNVNAKASLKSKTLSISRRIREPLVSSAAKNHKAKADKIAKKKKAYTILKSNLKEDTDRKLQEEALRSKQHLPTSSSNNTLVHYSPGNESETSALEKRVPNSKGKGRVDPRESTSYDLSMYESNRREDTMSDQQQPIQASTSSQVRYPPPNMSRGQPSGGFFEGSTENVEIKGGTINHTLGHHMNLTIHVNPPRDEHDMLQQHPHLSPLLQTRHHEPVSLPPQDLFQTNQFPPVASYGAGPSTSTSTTIYSPDNSNKIYERHLELKQRGFPLWIPEPNRNLPMSYRRKGVNIGDVGIITPSGGFLFLFNVCSPHDDPINPPTLPDGFVPIRIDSTRDIREDFEFKPESYLTSTAIEKTDNTPSFRGLSFSTSATEGAILTLPDGALSRDVVNIRRFRDYAKANIKNWYRYVNGTRGCEAKNGEIRLVTGCIKATSWGMAAIANMTQHKVHHLKYRSVDDFRASAAPIPLYKWEHTGFAEAKVGPDLSEIEDLKRDDPSDTAMGGKYWNQCLFIQTLNITLSNDDFARVSREIELALIEESQQLQNCGAPSNSASTLPNPSAQINNTGRQQGTNSAAQTRSTCESMGSVVETLAVDSAVRDRVITSRSQSAPISHPADVLNKILLEKVPNCQVVITQDEDWCSVIKEDDEIMPKPFEVAERVLAAHYIREEDGVVFLEPKEERQLALRRCQTHSGHSITDNAYSQRPTAGSPTLPVTDSRFLAPYDPETEWHLPTPNPLAMLNPNFDTTPHIVFGEYSEATYTAGIIPGDWQTQHPGWQIGNTDLYRGNYYGGAVYPVMEEVESFNPETGIRDDYHVFTQNSLLNKCIANQEPMEPLGLNYFTSPSSSDSSLLTVSDSQPGNPPGNFTCDYCDRSFTRIAGRLSHMRARHKKIECRSCGKQFARSWFSRHLKKCQGKSLVEGQGQR